MTSDNGGVGGLCTGVHLCALNTCHIRIVYPTREREREMAWEGEREGRGGDGESERGR